MVGRSRKPPNLDYLPYLIAKNGKTGQDLKILIDSGSNKNLLRPGLVKTFDKINTIDCETTFGSGKSDKTTELNLLSKLVPPQEFFIVKLHEYFDAFLGSEYMATNEAILNYKKETLTIRDVVFKYYKYYPRKRMKC